MARAWRGFHFRFTGFPPLWVAATIAVLAYANFFTHHYLPDIRWPLIIAGAFAFRKTLTHHNHTHARRRLTAKHRRRDKIWRNLLPTKAPNTQQHRPNHPKRKMDGISKFHKLLSTHSVQFVVQIFL